MWLGDFGYNRGFAITLTWDSAVIWEAFLFLLIPLGTEGSTVVSHSLWQRWGTVWQFPLPCQTAQSWLESSCLASDVQLGLVTWLAFITKM